MAQPPRNNPNDPAPGTQSQQGRSWGVYLAIIAIVLLVLYLLFGNVFSPDPVTNEEPAVGTSVPEAGTSGTGSEPVTADPDPVGGSQPAPADPSAGGDATAPGETTGQGEEDNIDIQGDADVEVLDESED